MLQSKVALNFYGREDLICLYYPTFTPCINPFIRNVWLGKVSFSTCNDKTKTQYTVNAYKVCEYNLLSCKTTSNLLTTQLAGKKSKACNKCLSNLQSRFFLNKQNTAVCEKDKSAISYNSSVCFIRYICIVFFLLYKKTYNLAQIETLNIL